MNIINIHTIQEEKEKKIRKDIFSKCMNEINEVPYDYSRTKPELIIADDGTSYQTGFSCPEVFNKVSDEFWECYRMSVMNGTNYDTGEDTDEDTDEDDY
jgi:hypothetical protein